MDGRPVSEDETELIARPGSEDETAASGLEDRLVSLS
jgi:hypothetical protein